MKSLVIGASGLVGSTLLKNLSAKGYETLGTYFNCPTEGLIYLDYSNKEEVKKTLNFFSPKIVWCPAGLTNVNYIEENEKESYLRNVQGLKNLFEACKEKNIIIVFFSTDYIFDGHGGPYAENDIPNPINIYGKHKLEAENLIKEILKEHYFIFRTTWVYGFERQGKNFVYSAVNNLSNDREIKVSDEMFSTPTYVEDLVNVSINLVEKKSYGLFNIAGSEYISRFDFAHKIAEVFKLNTNLIKKVKYETLNKPAKRPLKTGLKNDKAAKKINITWHTLKEGLQETKSQMERTGQFPVIEKNIKSKICIFIPCYNATSTLPKVFERIPKQIKNKVQEIFVVDNASKDYTYLMAVGLREKDKDIKNLKIFKNAKNFGYGGSQKLAYAYAIKQGYDLVIMLHGDAQYAPEKLPVMIEKMEKDPSIDLLFGSRMTGDPLAGGMPIHRYLGNKVLTWIQNILLNAKISEFHSGYRIFRTSSLKKIPFHLCDNDYHFDTEIIIQFINKGLKIDEVTINTFYGSEKCYVNIWKYAIDVAIVTTCYFLYKLGLRNIPKYKLYDKNLEADTEKIFAEFKTEIH